MVNRKEAEAQFVISASAPQHYQNHADFYDKQFEFGSGLAGPRCESGSGKLITTGTLAVALYLILVLGLKSIHHSDLDPCHSTFLQVLGIRDILARIRIRLLSSLILTKEAKKNFLIFFSYNLHTDT